MLAKFLFALLALSLTTPCLAQTMQMGVILSLTGENTLNDQGKRKALEVFEADLQKTSAYLTILLKDDGSSPLQAQAAAQELIDAGVQVLICCSSKATTEVILPLAQQAKVLMIGFTDLPEGYNWGYTLEPSTEKILQGILLDMADRGRKQLAVMTPDNILGDGVEAALRRLSVPGGVGILELLRYPLGVTVLTPEALWIATRQPDAVLLWGEVQDTTLAYQSLRERGFEKQVFVPPAMLRDAEVAKGLEGAFSMLGPVEADDLPSDHEAFAKVSAYQKQFVYLFGVEGYSSQGASMYDALSMANSAVQQVLSFGIGSDTQALRSAMTDVFSNLGTYSGLTASYTISQGEIFIQADSLVITRATSKLE